ncbi:histidinol-phosphatase [Actinomycetota bacterium]
MGHAHPPPPAAASREEEPSQEIARRTLLQAAGLLGLAATTGLATGCTQRSGGSGGIPRGGFTWLAGDHHIHTQHSHDGHYTVAEQVSRGAGFGLGWMVITDHGGKEHARIGVERVNPEIRAARERHRAVRLFQGLEWNIPAADHGTVFVHPGAGEVAVLRAFEQAHDGAVLRAADSSAANEALAVKGVHYLRSAVSDKRVRDALMFANHPARLGLDAPHEVRAWRDAASGIAVGWEAAPGHQAGGIPTARGGPGEARGHYDKGGRPGDTFAAYPSESFRTWGGFDFHTATVGGLWDSLLAEGKPWWITANSDSHAVYQAGGQGGPSSKEADDFWPGQYSRTHVGTRSATYAGVMAGLREGAVWVDHGHLVDEVDVRVTVDGQTVGLGGIARVRRGSSAELRLRVVTARRANSAGDVPRLARVDLVQGRVTGPASDPDVFHAPQTRVAHTWEVGGKEDLELVHPLGRVEDTGLYIRLRGSDGRRDQPGFHRSQDANGPAMDRPGDADPWADLWFYTNPVFVLPAD